MFHFGWLVGRFVSCGNKEKRMKAEKTWTPLRSFKKETQKDGKIALIILNRPIHDLVPFLEQVWDSAAIRAAADGGTNRLLECMPHENHRYIPEIVSGDFDSVRPEIVKLCKEKGSDVIHTPDQNATDFTKCLRIVVNLIKERSLEVESIMVFGAFGGRLDQTLANINTLFLASSITDLPVYLLGDGSLACILLPGHHRIKVNTGLEAEWCGLIPIGTECKRVSTTGLKWNLHNQGMKFGQLVSTSNTYAVNAHEVTVTNEQPLMWTMGIQPLNSSKAQAGSSGFDESPGHSEQQISEP